MFVGVFYLSVVFVVVKVTPIGASEEYTQVSLDLSKYGNTYLNEFIKSLAKLLRKHNFNDKSSLTVEFDIIPPTLPGVNVERNVERAIARYVAKVAPNVGVSGKIRTWMTENIVTKLKFILTLSTNDFKGEEKNDPIEISPDLHPEEIEKVVRKMYAQYKGSKISKMTRVIVPVGSNSSPEDFTEKIKRSFEEFLDTIVEHPDVAILNVVSVYDSGDEKMEKVEVDIGIANRKTEGNPLEGSSTNEKGTLSEHSMQISIVPKTNSSTRDLSVKAPSMITTRRSPVSSTILSVKRAKIKQLRSSRHISETELVGKSANMIDSENTNDPSYDNSDRSNGSSEDLEAMNGKDEQSGKNSRTEKRVDSEKLSKSGSLSDIPLIRLRDVPLGNGKSSMKEKIIDVLNETMEQENWETEEPKLLQFIFRTVKSKITPDEMKDVADALHGDLSDLEPSSLIYPASFDFGRNQEVIIKIPMKIPSAASSTIYHLKDRFPDIQQHMTTISSSDLGAIPSRVKQIVGYKLFTSRRVESGRVINLILPFKMRNEKDEMIHVSMRPLLIEILKKIEKLQYASYAVKDLDEGWKLLSIVVKIPYSRNRARFGLEADEEEGALNAEQHKKWYSRILG